MNVKKTGLVMILGIVFFSFGVFWLAAILHRCETIYPSTAAISAGEPAAVKATAVAQKLLDYYRSPYAKTYHFVLFWVIAVGEVACGLMYVLAGFSLARLFKFARRWVFVALSLDIVFKMATLAYLKFCAVPLAAATKNDNILSAYFFADSGTWDRFSGFVSGLTFFTMEMAMATMLYILILGFSLSLLNQPDVKPLFQKKK